MMVLTRIVSMALAGLALASCVAHGESGRIDPAIRVNYTPYSMDFYRKLMTGRVDVFEGLGRFRNVVQGQVFASDGTVIECSGRRRLDNKIHWVAQTSTRWKIVTQRSGARIEWDYGGDHKRYASKFYDPETGGFDTEILTDNQWIVTNPGQIQDSWPRALADACPGLKLPTHIRINEKQISLRMNELRRQDPDAPIRNFPGSHLTGPGRTGLAASGGRPTTSKKEVWAFLNSQEGNVMRGPRGHGRVFVRGAERSKRHDVWGLKDDGTLAWIADMVEYEEAGHEWLSWEFDDKSVARYRMGDPLPYLPTGHRHATFQLTDELIGKGEPVPLPWMGARYADHRFLFHDKTLTVVAPGETYLVGRWRWTKGQLQVWVDGEEQHAGSVAWRDLARELGVTPTVWTPDTPDRID
ncbi:MAG: hypothetical protein OXH05_03240 [Acidobacteria bacterium]|nr:hypothetical protein [Acidobacteriota bacterium]